MKKSIKRILAILIGAILVLPTFTGCGNIENGGNETQGVVFFDVNNPQLEISNYSARATTTTSVPKKVLRGQAENTMPIGGFTGPDYRYVINGKKIDLLNDQTFQLLEDCGINMLIQNGFSMNYGSEMTTKALTLADAHKINYFVPDDTIQIKYNTGDTYTDASSVGSVADIKTVLKKYTDDYKYFTGFYGADEPAEVSFGKIQESWTNYNQVIYDLGLENKGLSLYYNHIVVQTGYTDKRMTSAKYETYLNNYLATGGDYLMFDLYPFAIYQGNDKAHWGNWLNLLGLFSAMSAENNVPWWGFAQNGGNFDGAGETAFRIVNEGELNYNVNTMLAFGAKGISYFPACTPVIYAENENINTNDSGLINEYGQKTPRYYYAQQINKQIQAIDEYLMSCQFKGVIQTASYNFIDNGDHPSIYSEVYGRGSDTNSYKKSSYGILSSVSCGSGDYALVGCFDYGNVNAYYIVNDSFVNDDATVTLKFSGNNDYLIIQRGVVGTLKSKNQFGVRLSAGEGAFILQLKNSDPNANDNVVGDTTPFSV